MRHRLYYVLPDFDSARKTLDDLLLNRVEFRHVHFLTKGDNVPQDLPEANVFQRTDLVHGATIGMRSGAVLGLALGMLLVVYFDPVSKPPLLFAGVIIGILFGGWASSMMGASMSNSRLRHLLAPLDSKQVLMIVDVPALQVDLIEKRLAERHPESQFRGEDPAIPAFP